MINKNVMQLSNFFKSNKKKYLIILDIISCLASIWFSMYLRLDFFYPLFDLPIIFIVFSSLLLIIILQSFDIYKSINRFSGWNSFINLGKALIVYNSIFFMFFTIISFSDIPRSMGVLHPIIITLVILSSRASIRILLSHNFNNHYSENVLIYGAGEAGRQLASIINYSKKINLLGFLEDNNEFIGNKINNILVYNSKELSELKEKLKISSVFLALPSVPNEKKTIIIKKIQKYNITVKTLPTLSELETENISLSDLRPINIDELLGRKKVNTIDKINSKYISNETILITGAGGSIGSELCRQVLKHLPTKIILLDSSEFNLYTIKQELNESFSNNLYSEKNIIPILASVQDENALKYVFKKYKPTIIYHAAAYKHVPLVQSNPVEGIKNNVLGTELVANFAIKYNSKKFVLISTDKAVRPSNIMGASKRFAELIIQANNEISKNTIFTIVRFGNVLGSSGSVVPKFQDQINKGGPITLTHTNVTRFFMTAEEAIHLIIQAGGMSKGGEVFILKMGEPVAILELAKTMISLSGKTMKNKVNPNGDIAIKIVGLRDGEKMYEEVLIGNNPIITDNEMILKANEIFYDKKYITQQLQDLRKSLKNHDLIKINKLFALIITGYKNKTYTIPNEK